MIYDGMLLPWEEVEKMQNVFRDRGIVQFLNLHHQWKDRDGDVFKWGEEMEYMLAKFDEGNKVTRLLLNAETLLTILNQREKENLSGIKSLWSPEYASYMIEACPSQPYEGFLSCFEVVETNMRDRRKEVSDQLLDDETILTLANFPRIGAADFTWPIHKPRPEAEDSIERSMYFPDEAILQISLMTGTAMGIRNRRGKNVSVNAPVFKDEYTEIPVAGAPASKPDTLLLDAVGFGWGCCALQTTLQASNINEALLLHDQMAVLCPILIALTAATPVTRGYLLESDCRWVLLSETADARTDEELGVAPGKGNQTKIPKRRFDSIDSYLTPDGEKYKDVPLPYDQCNYQKLRDGGVNHLVAVHISQIFYRGTILIYEPMVNKFNENDTDYFDLMQKLIWPSIKLKCPMSSDIGWRIEFRPCDIQLTDFDNAAVACCIVLLSRIILANKLNLLIPISKLDENMQKTQKRDACGRERFWFRKNIFGNQTEGVDDDMELLTIDEIINGNGSKFCGLIPLISKYLSTLNVRSNLLSIIERYLGLLQLRASGILITPASWIRNEITNLPEYRKDSIVTERINHDLIKKIQEIQMEREFVQIYMALYCQNKHQAKVAAGSASVNCMRRHFNGSEMVFSSIICSSLYIFN